MAVVYVKQALTGGGATALDAVDGDSLSDNDIAFCYVSEIEYNYRLDATSGAAASSPDVIEPLLNAGTKRWILQAMYGAGTEAVTAASNLTDNYVVRGDGGAKGIQTSTVIIDDFGKVGINQSSPNQMLDVDGVINCNNGDTLADPTTSTGNGTRFSLGQSLVGNSYGNGISALRNGKYDIWYQVGNDNGGGFRWYKGATERMTIDYQGKVGIGTPSPSYKLSIGSPSDTYQIGIEAADDNTASFEGVGTYKFFGTEINISKGSSASYIGSRTYSDTSGVGPVFELFRSNTDTVGTDTATVDGNNLGSIFFTGVTAGLLEYTGAMIRGTHDGTSGSTRVPAKISFYTTNTSGSLTERMVIKNSGYVGIGEVAPDSPLEVNGLIHSTSLDGGAVNLTANASGQIIRDPSDARLKENIVNLTGSLNKLIQLQGREYSWKQDAGMGEATEYGLIAQEVAAVDEKLTITSMGNEFAGIGDLKSLNQRSLLALIIEAIKELNEKVDAL